MSAGYKDSIISMGPKAFYTFDNDTDFDPVSKMLFDPHVIDDSSNGNTGTITIVDEQGGGQSFGYSAGMLSLVEREQYPQQAITFGWRGFNSWSNLDQTDFPYVAYPKAFITCPYTIGTFDKIGGSPQPGSFTIVLHVRKEQKEDDAGGLKTQVSGVSDTLVHPIFAWDGILYLSFLEASFANTFNDFNLTISTGTGLFDKYINGTGTDKDPVGDSAAVDANMPTAQGDNTQDGPINYRKDNKHIVIVWRADNTTNKGQLTVYVDGETMFTHKMENALTSQVMHNWKQANMYIGGLPYVWTNNDVPYVSGIETPTSRAGNYGTYNIPQDFIDRATTAQHIDQVAIFDYALTRPQVGYLYMKTRNYFDTVVRLEPVEYLPLNEPNISGSTTVSKYTNPNVTTPDTNFVWHTTGPVVMGNEGPSNIQNSGAFRFDGGALVATGTTLSAKDLSIELWIKIDATFSDRGVIFSYASVDYPYEGGATIQVNWRNDALSVGAIQFSINNGTQISSRLGVTVTDGLWHHIVCIRKKNSLEMWIDGQKQGAIHNVLWVTSTSKIYSQIHMMNQQDGMLPIPGSLSNVAIYAYALQGWAIKYHYYYNVLYRIRGTTVELGGVEQTDVRLINHGDGTLSDRMLSDPLVGTFEFNPNISTYYDIFAIDSFFDIPTPRAFGPMIPSSYSDTAPYRRFNDSDYFNPGSDGHGSN